MIRILYGNILDIESQDIESFRLFLPQSMLKEVFRYKYEADQKARLLARAMLFNCLRDEGKQELLNKWKRDQYHKPFVEGWDNFNISHSGDWVVFCHSPIPLGIDIEKISAINYTGLLTNFHEEEIEFVRNAENSEKAFYTIWTKKEAFLKALGTGIAGIPGGLESYNCVNRSIQYQHRDWYFYELSFRQNYSCYLCCADKEAALNLDEFSFEPFPVV